MSLLTHPLDVEFSGSGDGSGYGSVYGSVYGDGSGSGYGSGSGDGNGSWVDARLSEWERRWEVDNG